MSARSRGRRSEARRRVARRRARFLLGFAAYFVLLWLLWDTRLVAPLKIFVVLLHEVSHGIAAVATGGSIDRIVITPDQGGACYCGGGNAFLTLSAGYLGSLAWGSGLVVLASRRGRWSRGAMGTIGIGILLLTLFAIRNLFGFAFGLVFGVGLVASARYLSAPANARILTALGLTSCLYAILDIKSDVLDRPELRSDAAMLAELTGVPTLVWGVVWIGAALALSWLLLRWLLRKA